MAYLYIDINKTIQASQELVAIARQLNGYQRSLEGIKLSRTMSRMGGDRIEKTLRRVVEEVGNEAVKMNSLGGALQAIVNQYRKTENTIVGMQVPERSPGTDTTPGTDKRKWRVKFWDWIRDRKTDEYDTTTLEQEKAADKAIRTRLWLILQNEKYSKETWDNASIEERKQILQDYMDEVAKIYGLKDVNSKIRWSHTSTYTEDSVTMGYYNDSTRTVSLNEKVLSDSVGNWDSYDLLGTVAHELRHAYQHEAIRHPTDFMVSQETIDSWKYNFDHYISGDDNYDDYRAQAVEVDARSFQIDRDSMDVFEAPSYRSDRWR